MTSLVSYPVVPYPEAQYLAKSGPDNKKINHIIYSILDLLPLTEVGVGAIKDAVTKNNLHEAMKLLKEKLNLSENDEKKLTKDPLNAIGLFIIPLKQLKESKLQNLIYDLNEIVMTGGSKRAMRKTSKRKNKKSKRRKTKYIGGNPDSLSDPSMDILPGIWLIILFVMIIFSFRGEPHPRPHQWTD